MSVTFGKALLDIEKSVLTSRERNWASDDAVKAKHAKKAAAYLASVEAARELPKIQALAEQLDDRFTLQYQSGTSEILHDRVEIWLDLPQGTTWWERIGLTHPHPEDKEAKTRTKPQELHTSLAAWRDNGMLPMVFKPSPEKQWRRALQTAIKLQRKLKTEGKL